MKVQSLEGFFNSYVHQPCSNHVFKTTFKTRMINLKCTLIVRKTLKLE